MKSTVQRMGGVVVGSTPTMTSLELVDFINADREAGGIPELTHANFMAKVPKVLGREGFIRPNDTYVHPQNGQTYPCYRFAKREACLMAMSYSYELQAKVFDRMTALEQSALPAIHDPVLAALVKSLVEVDALKLEQQRHSDELARIQETLAVVEARTQPDTSHFTVMGWANLMGRNITLQEASQLGRKCASLSKETGFSIGDIPDPRFGRVHTYHKSILVNVV